MNEGLGEEPGSDEIEKSKPKDESDSEHLGHLEKYELEFCYQLCPILVKVAQKLLQYGHLYVCSTPTPETPGVTPYSSTACLNAPRQALDVLLYLSGKSLVSPKGKAPYNSHLPEHVNTRLKMWESALPIDPMQKKKLSIYDDIQVAACMVNFLNLHFSAFSGTQTFNPSRSLKSAVCSVLSILEYVANIFHEHRQDAVASKMLWTLTMGMVPMSCDVMMEFAHSQLLKFVLNDHEYMSSCAKGRITRCLEVLRLPEMRESELMGTILADLFRLLIAMLQDLSEDDNLFEFFFSEKEKQATSE